MVLINSSIAVLPDMCKRRDHRALGGSQTPARSTQSPTARDDDRGQLLSGPKGSQCGFSWRTNWPRYLAFHRTLCSLDGSFFQVSCLELTQIPWSCDTRYITAILNPSKNPYRTAVATDVTNTILKMHAEKGKPAEYWDKDEQEERLIGMYNKWESKGTIWSAAAQKVCNGHTSNT